MRRVRLSRLIWPAMLAILFVLAGCQGEKGTVKADVPPTGPKPQIPKPTISGTEGARASISIDKLPAELKNDAFEYYGLGRTEPVEFVVISPSLPGGSEEASQTVRLIEVNDGAARFSMTYTGALAAQGEQEMLLKADGLYVVKAGGKVLPKPEMELPSPLTVGKTWHSHLSMDASTGDVIEVDADFRVVGPAKVKTKAGEFDAVKVTGTSTMKSKGTVSKQQLTGWYVKGTGQVKLSVKGLNGNPNETMSAEIVK